MIIVSLLLMNSSVETSGHDDEKFNPFFFMYQGQMKRPMNSSGLICDTFELHVKQKKRPNEKK